MDLPFSFFKVDDRVRIEASVAAASDRSYASRVKMCAIGVLIIDSIVFMAC